MIYNDRKILKWQGFYLSEHNAMLGEIEEEARRFTEVRTQQGLGLIGTLLEQSFIYQTLVSIQLNESEDGLFSEDLLGVIKGFEEGTAYLFCGGELVEIQLEDIRNVEARERVQWWE